MEHIFNVAISIDDEGIEKKATDYCVQQIYRDMKGTVLNDGYYGGKLTAQAEMIIDRWLTAHKDEIIDVAAKRIADKISRTKAMKEKVGELL